MTEYRPYTSLSLTPSVTAVTEYNWWGQRVEAYRLNHAKGASLGFSDVIGTVTAVPDEMYLTWAILFDEYVSAFVSSKRGDRTHRFNVPCPFADRDEAPVYEWLLEHRADYPVGFAFMAAFIYAWSEDGTLEDVKELLSARTTPGISYRDEDRAARSVEFFALPCYPFTPWGQYQVGFDVIRAMNAMYNYTVDGSWSETLRFPVHPVSEREAKSMSWLENYYHRTLEPIRVKRRSQGLPETIPPITLSPRPSLSPEQVPVFYYPLNLRSASISYYSNTGFMVALHRARVADGVVRPQSSTSARMYPMNSFLADSEEERHWYLASEKIISSNHAFIEASPHRLHHLLFALYARCGFNGDRLVDLMLFHGDSNEESVLNEPAILLTAFESGETGIIDALIENPEADRLLTINLFGLNSKQAELGKWQR